MSSEDGHAPEDSENEQFICKFEKVCFRTVFLQNVHGEQANRLNIFPTLGI